MSNNNSQLSGSYCSRSVYTLTLRMHCENTVYEEVQAVENDSYGCQESTHDISKCKSPVTPKSKKKKTLVIISLILATLTLLLFGVAAGTVYAVTEISQIKSVMQEERARMNASFEARFQQLQSASIACISNAELIASLDARITQSQQICGQNETGQNETTRMDDGLRAPVASCDALPASLPDGNYYVISATDSPVLQYCPPITTRCGQTGRWHSVANLDMRNSTHQCTSDLREDVFSSNKRVCVRSSDSSGCSSVQLSTPTAYRSVCGLIRAYQFGQPEAFHPSSSIDSPYVDGVSITHGSPRQHIWTFAAAFNEIEAFGHNGCPCIRGGNNSRPAFVENDYFCDTGSSTGRGAVFYDNNPLWDGAGCGTANTCCSFNNPPWFYKEMLQYVYNDIELRVCSDQVRTTEDIALERIEIFVK